MGSKTKYLVTLLMVTLFIAQFVGLIFNKAFAASEKEHDHNGRVHSHILPATGEKHFHKHMHNGRAHIHPYSAKIGFNHSHNLSARAKAWENAVRHEHAGRPHSHPLPPTGVKHDHRHNHNGRSHIHPLPATGNKHVHGKDKLNPSPPAKDYIELSKAPNALKVPELPKNSKVTEAPEAPEKITGLSIKQQMKAVLGNPIQNTAKVALIENKALAIAKPAKKIRKSKHLSKAKTRKKKTLKKVIPRKKQIKKIAKRKKTKPKKTIPKQAKKPVIKPLAKIKQTPEQVGNGNRQFNIALRYENGTGVPKNLPQAVNWYLRAAKNHNVKAQFNLASLYENGKGVKRNIPKALRWYKRAADQGDKRGRAKFNSLINGK